MREQSDTRQRIQEIALDLFTERGYEATSLREIAEQLGVTKAALYYHFKTKEDIVASLLEDRVEALQELLAWGRAQPRTAQTRVELLHRYATELHGHNSLKIMKFLERNQTALRDHRKRERLQSLTLGMVELISPEDADPATQLRHALALMSLHLAPHLLKDSGLSDADRRGAALTLALDLVDEDRPWTRQATGRDVSPAVGPGDPALIAVGRTGPGAEPGA